MELVQHGLPLGLPFRFRSFHFEVDDSGRLDDTKGYLVSIVQFMEFINGMNRQAVNDFAANLPPILG